MPAYKVRVTDAEGRLVVGATLWSPDDENAVRRFEALPLPAGRAELSIRQRVIARRELSGRRAAE
jgi:hypothetical protein